MTPEERRAEGIGELPGSLDEAIAEMSGSSFVKEILGSHVYSKYMEAKQEECNEYRTKVTKWEIDTYLMKY